MQSFPLRIASLVFAIIGGISSLILLVEKLHVLQDPNYVPSCSFSPIFSCQGPMSSWQSSALFGLPNYAVGLVGFTIMAMVLVLSFQAKLPRWIWGGYFLGALFSVSYCMWLMHETLYDIGALCLYCMFIWVCCIAIFWLSVKAFVLDFIPEQNRDIISEGSNQLVETRKPLAFAMRIVARLVPALLIAHYLVVILLVYLRFPGYFNYLLGITATPLG